MYQAVLGGFRKSKVKGGEQLGALKGARDQARKAISARAAAPGASASEAAAQAKAAGKTAAATAKGKFGGAPEQLKKAKTEAAVRTPWRSRSGIGCGPWMRPSNPAPRKA